MDYILQFSQFSRLSNLVNQYMSVKIPCSRNKHVKGLIISTEYGRETTDWKQSYPCFDHELWFFKWLVLMYVQNVFFVFVASSVLHKRRWNAKCS